MIIMGIDPGLSSTGIGIIQEQDSQSWKALFHGDVATSPRTDLPTRLAAIHDLVDDAIRKWNPEVVAVESIFFARNVKSAVLMAHGRGAAILAAARRRLPVHEYTPLEIKQSVVGKGQAGKEQVARMVGVLLGLGDVALSDHRTDALACALCHAFRAGAAARQRLARTEAPVAPPAASTTEDPRKLLLAQSMARRKHRRR